MVTAGRIRYILLLEPCQRVPHEAGTSPTYLAGQSSELLARPGHGVSCAEVMVGCVAYVKQRLNPRRVLGGLQLC